MKSAADPQLTKIRHSLAHLLAQAVLEIQPNARLGFGPPIDTGFYYDFDLDTPLTPEDLVTLEKRMKHLIRIQQSFVREELSATELIEKLTQAHQEDKALWAQELVDKGETGFSLYKSGNFWDMCEGPHVESTSEINPQAFSLDSLAGAYWRGSEKNKMMQRVYGLAFQTPEELVTFKKNREEALRRDHRRLNTQHHYFVIEDAVGKGLPLWLPNGTVLREELEKLAKETEFRYGYQRVSTPHITKEGLYQTSGHLPYYEESMFPPMELEGERFYLKPMNCPHHHMIYKALPRSYRDLPLRLAEYGTCYRYEQSGELSGLLRVRGLTMNDAHIYCTMDQVEEEFSQVIRMHMEYYQLFGITRYWTRLSLSEANNEKYDSQSEVWEKAEQVIQRAMDAVGVPYESVRGEAAFYGPKIDFQIANVVGREETASTNQLDLIMPERFDLTYRGSDNQDHRPVIIHRAPLGTHERFCAFLIEHYAGAFPTWLAPVQVRLIPIAAEFQNYASQLATTLKNAWVRAEVDESQDSFSKKIRNGATSKIPNTLILGEKEQSQQSVTWQRYGSPDRQFCSFDSFLQELTDEIRQRRDWRSLL